MVSELQEAVGRTLSSWSKSFSSKAGFLGCTCNQLAVIERNAKVEREFSADLTAACTILTANSDNQIGYS